MQTQTPLITQHGHLFARIGGRDWIVDTGSPISFGDEAVLQLAGQSFDVANGYMGLTADALSDFIGHPAEGLIGTDILNHFDVVFDTDAGLLTLAYEELPSRHEGVSLPLSFFMDACPQSRLSPVRHA